MKITLKCYGCKQEFRRTELVQYAGQGVTMHWYCRDCLQEKQNREMFAAKVSQIFGLKNPGPRIWTERKRLREKYGYTDKTIVDCLEYIYHVETKKILAESLCLVTPPMVDRMLKYKRMRESQGNSFIRAINTEQEKTIVSINEESKKKVEQLNPDDWLDD